VATRDASAFVLPPEDKSRVFHTVAIGTGLSEGIPRGPVVLFLWWNPHSRRSPDAGNPSVVAARRFCLPTRHRNDSPY